MGNKNNNQIIYAFSGAQNTGKTTAVFEKAYDLKKKHPDKEVLFISETTHLCPFPINQGTQPESQMWMFSKQIQNELDLIGRNKNGNFLIVSDRAVFDAIAYSIRAGFTKLAEDMLALAKHHLPFYKKIYFKKIKDFTYKVHQNGIRDVDLKFREDIENILLKEVYSSCDGIDLVFC